MRLIISTFLAFVLSACAPDIPDQSDIDCGDVNCFEIAKQLCDVGYMVLCHDYNPRLIWCMKQLREETPAPDFWEKCNDLFIQEPV